jgi:hypothetical protein
MTRFLRVAAAVVIAVTTVLFIHRLWQRNECNIEEAETKRRVERLDLRSESVSSRIAARDLVTRVSHCIAIEPTNVGQYMLRAALFRILKRPDDAVADYRCALTVDRRSELYLNLGEAELESGRQVEAVDTLTVAALTNWVFLSEIPQPQRDLVEATVAPLREALYAGRPPPGVFDELHERIATGSKTR